MEEFIFITLAILMGIMMALFNFLLLLFIVKIIKENKRCEESYKRKPTQRG